MLDNVLAWMRRLQNRRRKKALTPRVERRPRKLDFAILEDRVPVSEQVGPFLALSAMSLAGGLEPVLGRRGTPEPGMLGKGDALGGMPLAAVPRAADLPLLSRAATAGASPAPALPEGRPAGESRPFTIGSGLFNNLGDDLASLLSLDGGDGLSTRLRPGEV